MLQRVGMFLCVAVLLAGCHLQAPPAIAVLPATMGEPFTLRWGETARLSDAQLDITFASVITDGRCPTSTTCTATLPVRVAVTVQDTGSSGASELLLSAHTDADGQVIPGAPGVLPADRYGTAIITLTSVTPYPQTRAPIPQAAYAVTLVVTSLSARIDPPATPGDVPAAAAPELRMGDEFPLKPGETAVLDDIGLRLTFEEIVEDSRCPADVLCVWSGIVDVGLSTALPGEPPQRFVVGGATDAQGTITGPVVGASGPTEWWYAGYTVALKQVTPYPAQASAPTAPEAYRVTLLVTPAMSPPGATAVPPAPPPALPFPMDADGLPILCISEIALTQQIAGASNESPLLLTPPVAAITLENREAATALCESQFGPGYHIAQAGDLTSLWTEFLPAGTDYWLWDEESARPAPG